MDKEELTKFCKIIHIQIRVYEFWKDSSMLQDRAFLHSLSHISRYKTIIGPS